MIVQDVFAQAMTQIGDAVIPTFLKSGRHDPEFYGDLWRTTTP